MTNQPAPGQLAPGFELPNQHGEPVSLSALRGTAVVLVFYPFAFSRVCTDELDELQANLGEFRSRSARVLAISTDHKYALRTYAEQRGYGFDLLSDFWPHGAVAEQYSVLNVSGGHARRSTFFVDRAGLVISHLDARPGEGRPFESYRSALLGLSEETATLPR